MRVRLHKDINGQNGVTERHIWRCDVVEGFFTHPPLSRTELDMLYQTYHGQARRTLATSRVIHQAFFIKQVLHNNLNPNATVVEAGCSFGYLLSKFGAPGRQLICFKPGAAFFKPTDTLLHGTNASRSRLNPTMFDAAAPELAGGIDLFLSSHVLEHIGDLCTFLSTLYAKMNDNGFVFTEVPNHDLEYVTVEQGGTYHLTLLTPSSLLAYFSSAGFSLVAMNVADQRDLPRGGGFHIRAVHQKLPAGTTKRKKTPFRFHEGLLTEFHRPRKDPALSRS